MREVVLSRKSIAVSLLLAATFCGPRAEASDWPMWRYDAERTAATPSSLPGELHLQWVRVLPEPRPAWPATQEKLQFDRSYEPVVMDGTLFVPSMVSDHVTAYATDTGQEKWRYYAEGPVRFAPVAWKGKVYFVSDDGCLYCVDAATGKPRWKSRGGPSDRKLLGNERLISAWPARGAPVIHDNTIYFAASIWPFMGIFIHALNAETGEVQWTNSGSGSIYCRQQHDSEAFAGVAPQGYLVATKDRLLVSGGRTVPAGYDRRSGKFLYFNVAERAYGNDTGGYVVAAQRDWFFNGSVMYNLSDGAGFLGTGATVIAHGAVVNTDGTGKLMAHALEPRKEQYVDRKGEKKERVVLPKLWEATTAPAVKRVFIAAGPRFYGSGDGGLVAAVDVPKQDGPAKVSWQARIEGDAWNMLAADGKLFVVTRQGAIYCFGDKKPAEVKRHEWKPSDPRPPASDKWTSTARMILDETRQADGYCLVLGVGSGRLMEELAAQSKLHVIGLDADAGKVDQLRRKLDGAGLYGRRCALLVGDITSVELPRYLASLVVSENLESAGVAKEQFVERVFDVLRPYGGAAWFAAEGPGVGLAKRMSAAKLAGAEVHEKAGQSVTLIRAGALPGSAYWTHQYGDVANTVVSSDQRVKAPLGLLWFGGASHDKILPRHGHGPAPQVAGGRLFIEGPDVLRALDVYTGRLLWEDQLPGVGQFYDHTSHEPGANAIGSNYVSLPDAVYVVHDNKCLKLDPTTGKTASTFQLPPGKPGEGAPEWGYIGVYEDTLLAGARPLTFWSPEFEPGEFRETGVEQLRARAADMRKWQGFEFVSQRPGDNEKILTDFLARNLNRLLIEKSVLDRIPADVKDRALKDAKRAGEVKKLQQQIGEHLRSRSASQAEEDTRLMELNRRLLSCVYPLPALRAPVQPGLNSPNRTASRRLVAMDRNAGKVRWTFDARYALRHNAIAAGGGKVFCIDRWPEAVIKRLERRGAAPPTDARIVALDVRTGGESWSVNENVFGTWLGYSAEHDLLVQAGSRERDRAFDEAGKGMVVYKAADGTVVWKNDLEYGGPVMLHHDTIITQGAALSLLTGEEKKRPHPLTGRPVPWRFIRNYGCNTAIASEHLLTFRSAAAGFYDLVTDCGTGNLGGFKSGCTSNLIAADGVLNAPDYTRTCTCSYQNQTSLAVVHDPDAEMWTFTAVARDEEAPVLRVGINFGAPGDRVAADGVLWLDYPSVGGPSPDVPIEVQPGGIEWFRQHTSLMADGGLKWVAASGAKGLTKAVITLAKPDLPPRSYTVRLHFAEPEPLGPGERVFDVSLRGRQVLNDFDIVKEAGAARKGIIKEFKGIRVADRLELTLSPSGSTKRREPVICGMEIAAEDAPGK